MCTLISISGRKIGVDFPPYVIAEISGNHNGDLARALRLVEIAAESGADAVKLQTYTADTLTIDHDGPDFQIHGGLWDGYNLHQLYDWAHTPWDWHEALFAYGRELGITVFSTPYDKSAVDFLDGLGVPAYKIASFEIVDLALLEYVASKKKPVIVSTGMASFQEIAEAVDVVRHGGCKEIALLYCVSGYPTPVEEASIQTLCDLAESFDVVIGLSDHTLGVHVPVAAVALGAAVIEKHITIARADGGPDAAFSLEPSELLSLCEGVRIAWSAKGDGGYERAASEAANVMFRRSLYVVEDIEVGGTLTEDNIRSIRPGFGLAPKYFAEVLGSKANQSLKRGTPLELAFIADGGGHDQT